MLTYVCEDTRGNAATLQRTVRVRDQEPPTLSVRGGPQQCVVAGDVYVEYGVMCIDNLDSVFEGSVLGPPEG